jgi:signal transduction histidine kinase
MLRKDLSLSSQAQEVMFSRILLIEDEEAHSYLIMRAMKHLAGSVELAATVADGIERIEKDSFDLVISDLNLPDSKPGLSIKRIIDVAGTVPVIVLTSSRRLNDAVEAMKFGARDFLVKEFDSSFQEVLTLALSRLFATVQLEREKSRLQRETSILRVAVENSADAMAIVDRDGRVEYANKAFHSFLRRCGADDFSHIANLFTDAIVGHESTRDAVLAKLQSLEAGAVWQNELLFHKERNVAFDFSLSGIPVDDSDRQEPCVAWLRDISEQKRREKFQREILSTTSHDLKGPLGSISLSAELIQDMTEKEERTHQLALRIESSARGAINLIDEFLSARRIQEGTFVLRPEKQALLPVVKTVVEEYGSLAAPKNISVQIDVGADIEGTVDNLGFTRVVGNLLTNALKFTDKGGEVFIRARTVPTGIEIDVADTGSGMEAGEITKIFERFSRLEKHQAIAGSGIGLFVVKSLVAAHGGPVEVTSKPGQGTTFTLCFPAEPPVDARGELISLDFE